MNLADRRREYTRAIFDESTAAADPFEQFQRWLADAESAELLEPAAMTLATADADGAPSARIVLLKGIDRSGFQFFTDHRSHKGRDLAVNPRAALVFHWPDLERQVRIEGTVERLDAATSAAYYHSRPRGSQIGAWASHQSSVLSDRAELERAVERAQQQFGDGEIPLPPHWGGYRVCPDTMEFWQGRPSRLHDRIAYTRTPDHAWQRIRLAP